MCAGEQSRALCGESKDGTQKPTYQLQPVFDIIYRMISLPINIENIGFVQREKVNGVSVKNKCGRDFLYYSLNYYLPNIFNPIKCSIVEIEKLKLFGLSLPAFLAWTQLQFYKLPRFLKTNNLTLKINNRTINNFFDFVSSILFSRISYSTAIARIEDNIKNGRVSGVDVSLGFLGLLDHVMFVYGYDEESLYVFDTHKVSHLNYEKITNDNRYFMKLSKREVVERWSIFSRVWEVDRLS